MRSLPTRYRRQLLAPRLHLYRSICLAPPWRQRQRQRWRLRAQSTARNMRIKQRAKSKRRRIASSDAGSRRRWLACADNVPRM